MTMTAKRSTLTCAGVRIDGENRTVTVLGRMVPVTCLSYSEATPERPGCWRVRNPEAAAITLAIYGTPERVAEAVERTIPATSEAVHFAIPCENGWWIDVSLYPEDDELNVALPGEGYGREADAAELLALIAEVGSRPQYVPEDEFDNPWGGLEPGGWIHTTFGPDIANREGDGEA